MPKPDKKSQSSGLVPIGQFLPGMEELADIKPILPKDLNPRGMGVTPQARHHFTRLQQIEALAGLADSPSDIGFMARLLTLCSLPRTDPGPRREYKRQNGPYRLYMQAGPETKLPFGNLPRLLLAWVSTEAVRTQSRTLILGHSLQSFMGDLGMTSDSGGSRSDRTRLKSQIERLFGAQIHLIYDGPGHKMTARSAIADRTEFWWDYKKPEQDTLWQSQIYLGEGFFNEIITHPVPLDMRILKDMRRSSLGLDLYMWLSYKTFTLYRQGKKPERLTWEQLYRQFGADPQKAGNKFALRDFRADVLRELAKLRLCWPTLDFATPKGCLEIRGCAPSIPPKELPPRQA